jgi:FkbM family methyltransferase
LFSISSMNDRVHRATIADNARRSRSSRDDLDRRATRLCLSSRDRYRRGVSRHRSFNAVERIVSRLGRLLPGERGLLHLARLARCTVPAGRRFEWVRTPYGLLLRLDLTVYPDVCIAYGFYEQRTTRLLRRLLRPGDHFVDVGANLGLMSLLASRLVGPGGRVDAIEPTPANHARLREHIEANRESDRAVAACDVIAHDCAVTDREGSAEIFFPDPRVTNHGRSSLYRDDRFAREPTPVRTRPLDALLNGATPHLVKIDVEGAEPLVIDGLRESLRAPRPPTLLVENNPTTARTAGFAAGEWLTRLRRHNPRCEASVVETGQTIEDVETLANVGQVNVLVRFDVG